MSRNGICVQRMGTTLYSIFVVAKVREFSMSQKDAVEFYEYHPVNAHKRAKNLGGIFYLWKTLLSIFLGRD